MSVFYSEKEKRVIMKCDGCGTIVNGSFGETDKCEMTCCVAKDLDWMQIKISGKWKQYCPKCKEEYYRRKRENYFKRMFEI